MLAIANIYLVHWEVSNFYDNKNMDDNEYLVYLKHNMRLGRWIEAHYPAIADIIHRAG